MLRWQVLKTAKRYVALCKMTADDLVMDSYLVKTYGFKLKNLCYYLVTQATFQTNGNDSIIVLFKNKKLDTLARIITYGNGKINGSAMLKKALTVLK